MNDFLSFRTMITPVIIKIIFLIGVVWTVIAALLTMLQGGVNVLAGLIFLFVGPLLVRIYCEILIVIFRINETLTEIKQNTQQQA